MKINEKLKSDKAKTLLNYDPKFSMRQGLKQACDWYWENLR